MILFSISQSNFSAAISLTNIFCRVRRGHPVQQWPPCTGRSVPIVIAPLWPVIAVRPVIQRNSRPLQDHPAPTPDTDLRPNLPPARVEEPLTTCGPATPAPRKDDAENFRSIPWLAGGKLHGLFGVIIGVQDKN